MSEFSVSLLLKVVKEQFVQGLREGAAQAAQQFNSIQQSAQTAARATNDALGTAGTASVRKLGEEAARAKPALDELGRSAGIAGNSAANAAEAARAKVAQLKDESRAVGPALASGASGADALKSAIAGAFSAAAVIQFTREVLNATLAHQKLLNTLQFVAGSAKGAGEEYEFVRATANRLGLELNSTGAAYAKLAAASKGTQLEGAQTRQIFTSVAAAATTLGLSSSELEGALLAVSQIISKGTVSAEELRGQLGERLPGAFGIAARSIGVTEQELAKMLETGSLTANQFLPAFASELQKAFGASSVQAAQGLNAQINRLKNSFQELLLSIAGAGGEGAIVSVVAALADGLTSLKKAIDSLSKADLSKLGQDFNSLLATVKDLVASQVELAGTVLRSISDALDVIFKGWTGIAGNTRDATSEASALQRVVQGLQISLAGVADITRGVAAALNLTVVTIAGTIEKLANAEAAIIERISAKQGAVLRQLANDAGDLADKAALRAEASLAKFGTSTIATLERLSAQAKQTAADITLMGPPIELMAAPIANVDALFKSLGVDVIKVAVDIRSSFALMLIDLVKLGESGQATSHQIVEAVRNLAESANSVKEVQRLKDVVVDLGKRFEFAGNDGAKAFGYIEVAAAKAAGVVDGPLRDAMTRLDVSSRESLGRLAELAKKDFKEVEEAGVLTAGGIREAFLKVLEAVAKANNGAIPATDLAKAALLGLRDEAQKIADKYDLISGKAKKAGDDQADAARKAAAAVKDTGDSQEILNARMHDGADVAQLVADNINAAKSQVIEMGAAAVATFQRKTGIFAGFTDGLESMRAGLKDTQAQLTQLNRTFVAMGGNSVPDYLASLKKSFLETKLEFLAAKIQAEQFARQQQRIADEVAKVQKAQEKVAEATRVATDRATELRGVFDTIADGVTFGVARVGDLANALARARRAADPIADAMREIAREATRSAQAFAGSATSIREELLQLQGREAEGAALRFQQRAAELELEFKIQRARLQFAIAQSRDDKERELLKQAISDLQQSYGQAAADLDRIRQITLANIEEEARKREEERQADARAKIQQQAEEAQRDREQALERAVRDRQEQERAVTEAANLRARSVQEEERARLAARDREFQVVRQQVAEEQQLRLQGISQSQAAEIARRAINNAASQAPSVSQFAGIVNSAALPGRGSGIPTQSIQNNYFTIDGTDLLSEQAVRRNVIPVLDDYNRRKT